MRILVVEDEVRLAQTICDLLCAAHYLVDVVHDGQSVLDCAQSGIYDGAIFDIMLPKLDGLSAVKALRQGGSSLPVLILTARTQLDDRVKGLDSGADYYLTKPFQREELLACLRALLRRKDEIQSDEIRFGDLRLDTQRASLSCGDNEMILSAREMELLRLLMRNGTVIVPKETLILKVWGFDNEAESNVLEVYISFLRRKIKHLGANVRIEAVRRMGYHLQEGDTCLKN